VEICEYGVISIDSAGDLAVSHRLWGECGDGKE
jgi:hypothetical protein